MLRSPGFWFRWAQIALEGNCATRKRYEDDELDAVMSTTGPANGDDVLSDENGNGSVKAPIDFSVKMENVASFKPKYCIGYWDDPDDGYNPV